MKVTIPHYEDRPATPKDQRIYRSHEQGGAIMTSPLDKIEEVLQWVRDELRNTQYKTRIEQVDQALAECKKLRERCPDGIGIVYGRDHNPPVALASSKKSVNIYAQAAKALHDFIGGSGGG